jgi:hypothetical protein
LVGQDFMFAEGTFSMRSSRAVVLVLGVLAAFGLACGGGDGGSSTTGGGDASGPPAQAPPSVSQVKIGESLTLRTNLFGSKSAVTITVSNLRAGVKANNNFEKPSNGQYIVADVLAVVGEGKVSISSGAFKLVAADGTAYSTTMLTGYNAISGSDLVTGQKTSGAIVFDAKPGAQTGGKIALTDLFSSGDAGYWII